MSQFFIEYGLFLLKVVTIVVAVIIVIIAATAASRRGSQDGLEVESLNEKYKSLAHSLRSAVLNKDEQKKEAKSEKKRRKAEAKQESRSCSFIIDFKGDLKASAVPSLREEVSAILDVATDSDEVIVRLENHGGVVHEHGLAASQLARIRDHGDALALRTSKVLHELSHFDCSHRSVEALVTCLGAGTFDRLFDGIGCQNRVHYWNRMG